MGHGTVIVYVGCMQQTQPEIDQMNLTLDLESFSYYVIKHLTSSLSNLVTYSVKSDSFL